MLFLVGETPGVDPWRVQLGLPGALAGWLLVILGVAIVVSASLQLSRARAFTGLPKPRPGGELVQSGLYARVRHPLYSGLALAGLGWAIIGGSPVALVLDVALVPVLYFKAAREEAWLASRYPGYEAYRARTKRLIPGVL